MLRFGRIKTSCAVSMHKLFQHHYGMRLLGFFIRINISAIRWRFQFIFGRISWISAIFLLPDYLTYWFRKCDKRFTPNDSISSKLIRTSVITVFYMKYCRVIRWLSSNQLAAAPQVRVQIPLVSISQDFRHILGLGVVAELLVFTPLWYRGVRSFSALVCSTTWHHGVCQTIVS